MNDGAEFLAVYNQLVAVMPDWFREVFGAETVAELLWSNALGALGIGTVGWLVATYFERRHFSAIRARERVLADILLSTTGRAAATAGEGTLLVGSVVIAHDYFRTLIISFRKLFGGAIKPYERLMDRGRREALLRLREEARIRGLFRVINVRFMSTVVSGRFLTGVELVAYGTGVTGTNRPAGRS